MDFIAQNVEATPSTMPIPGVKRKVPLDHRESVKKVRRVKDSFQSGLS